MVTRLVSSPQGSPAVHVSPCGHVSPLRMGAVACSLGDGVVGGGLAHLCLLH